MAASEHLQPEQLALFMSATDLWKMLNVSYDRHPVADPSGRPRLETMDELKERKVAESKQPSSILTHGGGVYSSIWDKGYASDVEPIDLVHQTTGSKRLRDGHHRVAAASDIEQKYGDPVWIPLVHSEEDPKSENWFDNDEYKFVSTRPYSPSSKGK